LFFFGFNAGSVIKTGCCLWKIKGRRKEEERRKKKKEEKEEI